VKFTAKLTVARPTIGRLPAAAAEISCSSPPPGRLASKTLLRSYCAQHLDKEIIAAQPKRADVSG